MQARHGCCINGKEFGGRGRTLGLRVVVLVSEHVELLELGWVSCRGLRPDVGVGRF